jgi:hypothetical protein
MYLPSRTGVHRIASLMPPVFACPGGQARAARTVCTCRYGRIYDFPIEEKIDLTFG